MSDLSNTRLVSSWPARRAVGSRRELVTEAVPSTASETLHARRAKLLDKLSEIRAELRSEVGRAIDSDPSLHAARFERVDALDEIAGAAETELGEIENRLAEARAGGNGSVRRLPEIDSGARVSARR